MTWVFPLGGDLLRRAKPGGDDELAAVEIEIGGPASVFPARRHEEEAAEGEVGEGVFAGGEATSSQSSGFFTTRPTLRFSNAYEKLTPQTYNGYLR